MTGDAELYLRPGMRRRSRGKARGAARGQLSRALAERTFPYAVAIEMPDLGLGSVRVSAIQRWHADHGCRQVCAWGDGTLIYRFATIDLARDFADSFDGRLVSPASS